MESAQGLSEPGMLSMRLAILLACLIAYPPVYADQLKKTDRAIKATGNPKAKESDSKSGESQQQSNAPFVFIDERRTEVQKETTKDDDAEAKQKIDSDTRIANATDRIATLTIFLVIVGLLQFVGLIVQAVFLGKALRESKRAGDTAETMLNATHRPWLRVDEIFLIRPDFKNGQFHGGLWMKARNIGNSPAVSVRQFSVFKIGAFDGDITAIVATALKEGHASPNLSIVYPEHGIDEEFPFIQGMPEGFGVNDAFHVMCGFAYRFAFGKDDAFKFVAQEYLVRGQAVQTLFYIEAC